MTKDRKSVIQRLGNMKEHTLDNEVDEYIRESWKSSGGFGNYLKKNFLLIMIALGVWVIAYYQITSHHLGLDVHDVSNTKKELEEGMVLTCEPGIYILEESLGVRLENDVLVTANNPNDLMKNGEFNKVFM